MSKHDKNKAEAENKYFVITALQEAYDRLEGPYSNIPECCVEGYINGRTYMNVLNSLEEKDKERLYKWNYVPCKECFDNNRVNKLKKNGTSDLGRIIFSLIEILRDKRIKEKANERKSNKRSKK